MALTRDSASITWPAASELNWDNAYTAVRIWDSTRPPISMTRVEIAVSSESNWLERCLSVIGVLLVDQPKRPVM